RGASAPFFRSVPCCLALVARPAGGKCLARIGNRPRPRRRIASSAPCESGRRGGIGPPRPFPEEGGSSLTPLRVPLYKATMHTLAHILLLDVPRVTTTHS